MKIKRHPGGRRPGVKNRPSVRLLPPEWALAREIATTLGHPWGPGTVAQAALRFGLAVMAERHGIEVAEDEP